MSESITEEELKEAIALWAPKFDLIRELWPGASIEDSLKLMAVIEDRAGELKEEKKKTMGFGAQVDKKISKTERKVQANSPFNDGWTKQFYEDQSKLSEEKIKKVKKVKEISHTEKVKEFDLKKKKKKNTREFLKNIKNIGSDAKGWACPDYSQPLPNPYKTKEIRRVPYEQTRSAVEGEV